MSGRRIGTILAVRAGDMPLLLRRAARQRLGPFRRVGPVRRRLPDVVPREQVVTMNSVATATRRDRGLPAAPTSCWCPAGSSARATRGRGDHLHRHDPLPIALLLSLRFAPAYSGPTTPRGAIHGSVVYAVITGWLHGARTVLEHPRSAATLSGLAAHRMVVGINSLLVLLLVRAHRAAIGGLGARACVRGRRGDWILARRRFDAAGGAPVGALRHGKRRFGGGRAPSRSPGSACSCRS